MHKHKKHVCMTSVCIIEQIKDLNNKICYQVYGHQRLRSDWTDLA